MDSRYVRTVRTVQPVSADMIEERHLSGMVSESGVISLGFKTAGQIERIYVKEGDFVNKGELLATLDDSDYEIGAEGLRAQAAQLRSELERSEKLYRQNSMSLNDYEKIKAGYAQLQSQLKGVENKLAYTKLYAPVSGHVQSVNFSKAEMVDAGTPVLDLMDDGTKEIIIDIPASIYHRLSTVSAFKAYLPDSGAEIQLQMLSVVPKADGNQLFKMKLAPVAGGSNLMTSGMNVDVAICFSNNSAIDSTSKIPAHSIVRKGGGTFVWVVGKDSLLQRLEVTLDGMDSEGMVIVTSGLKSNDNVVSSGVNMLKDGEKVKILEKPAETNIGGLL